MPWRGFRHPSIPLVSHEISIYGLVIGGRLWNLGKFDHQLMNQHKRFSFSAMIFLAACCSLRADVKLPAIFGDHMVLQEGMKLPIWGTADPAEAVTVTLGDQTAKTTADSNGKWRVEFPPIAGGPHPVTVGVTGKNSITLNDVLIGDVWVCSGQSNMEFGMDMTEDTKKEISQANLPQLRLFCVPKTTSLTPLDDLQGVKSDSLQGHWQICSPETLAKDGTWSGFSAVGYFFGREIQKKTVHPVGLIASDWGGTRAQAWTSLSGLQKDPVLQHLVSEHDRTVANYPKAKPVYDVQFAAYRSDLAAWQTNVAPAYKATLDQWNAAVKAAQAAHQPSPPKPEPSTPMPHAPHDADGGANGPTNLFNAMISPLIPFGIKGVIWYQGESNAGQPQEYRTLFSRLINDWREKWGEGDFPFLFVELASFKAPGSNWSLLREAQRAALALPNTGMATAVDIGNPDNIHPSDKKDVGKRLALVARHVAYGEKLVCSGPVFDAMKLNGSSITLTFKDEGGGLIIGKAPWVPPGFQPLPTTDLLGLTIAGGDKKWVAAGARIVGSTVVVSSPQVPDPVAVRYDWANAPQGNLYNQENLPASPFRTDDWVDPTTPL